MQNNCEHENKLDLNQKNGNFSNKIKLPNNDSTAAIASVKIGGALANDLIEPSVCLQTPFI